MDLGLKGLVKLLYFYCSGYWFVNHSVLIVDSYTFPLKFGFDCNRACLSYFGTFMIVALYTSILFYNMVPGPRWAC